MTPAVFTFLVHFEAVNIVFHSGNLVTPLIELGDDFFDQGSFSTTRFSYDRNNWYHFVVLISDYGIAEGILPAFTISLDNNP
jgi:hypothetical protein